MAIVYRIVFIAHGPLGNSLEYLGGHETRPRLSHTDVRVYPSPGEEYPASASGEVNIARTPVPRGMQRAQLDSGVDHEQVVEVKR